MYAFFISLFLNLAIAALQKVEPTNARKYGLSELNVQTATEDRAQALPFGLARLSGNCLWFGDYRASSVTKRVKTGLFSKANQTVGYRYHVGQWLSFAGAPCDEVTEVWLGDKLVWSGSVTLSKTSPTHIDIDKTWSTSEDQEVLDGICGRLTFFNHVEDVARAPEIEHWNAPPSWYDQPLDDAYLTAQVDGGQPLPRYPNTLHALWHGPSSAHKVNGKPCGFLSISNQIESLRITVRRQPAWQHLSVNHGNLTVLPPGGSGRVSVQNLFSTHLRPYLSIDGLANPALAALEILTTRIPGVGPRLSGWAVDLDAFALAIKRVHQDGLGLAHSWDTSKPVTDMLSDLCKFMTGFLGLNHRTGQLTLKLARESDVPLHAFDDDNIIELASFTRTTIKDAPALIEVPFVDIENEWIERVCYAKNTAAARANGNAALARAEFIGVSNARVAALLAMREMRRTGSALARATLTAFLPAGIVLSPGDLVTVEHSRLGQTLRMRIVSTRYYDPANRARVEIEALEDVFRGGVEGFEPVFTPPPVQSLPARPGALTNAAILLAPYALHGDEYDRPLYVADAAAGTYSFTAASSETVGWGGGVVEYEAGEGAPAITANLSSPLGTTGATVVVPLMLNAVQLDAWSRHEGGPMYVIAGDEWMLVEAASLAGNTLTLTCARGIFDTVPAAHAADSAVRVLLGAYVLETRVRTVPAPGLPALAGVQALTVRAESHGPSGRLSVDESPESTAVFEHIEAVCRAPKPLPPGAVSLGGVLGPLSDYESAPTVSRSAVELRWVNRNRLSMQPLPYSSAIDAAEPGTFVSYAVDEWDGSVWVEGAPADTAPAANSDTLDLVTLAPTTTKLRVRITTVRLVAGVRIESNIAVSYYTLDT